MALARTVNMEMDPLSQETGGLRARVDELLLAAAEFAAISMDRLIHQMDDDRFQLRQLFHDYVEHVHELEVAFCFPNASSREREILVKILGARNSLKVGLTGVRQWRTTDQRMEHESVISKLKARFLLLRAELSKEELRRRLTPVQQALLDFEFLRLPNPETEDKTGFFRNPKPRSGGVCGTPRRRRVPKAPTMCPRS